MKVLKIISWIFSIILLLFGLCSLFLSPVAGIFFILAGLILLPPLYTAIKTLMLKKYKFKVQTWQKSVAIALCILISFIAIANTPSTTTANTSLDSSLGTSSNSQNSAVSSSSNTTSSRDSASVQDTSSTSVPISNNLTVSYIDVGQGDSELIQQGDQDMLIDAGTSESETALINYVKPRIHGKLEYLVLTHPHEDHIGGADKIINAYSIGTVYMPNVTTTTKAYESVLLALQGKALKHSQPTLGSTFKLGTANCNVLGPAGFDTKNLNTYSIVIKITFGSTKFLFTGDAEEYNEKFMISKGYDLSADVLKVGHHGSDTSTSASFLKAVNPKYAVIEVGKENSYGHPKQTTLTRLHAAKVNVYRTDLDSTVIATSNGKKITFNKQPSANEYIAGQKNSSAVNKPTPSKSNDNTNQNKTSKRDTSSKSTGSTKNQSKIVYWTQNGKSYHYDRNCQTLKRSKKILSGTLSDAISAGKKDPCDKCVH
jgi:competence protein ComEC